jgi:NAD(P)H-nitrite reductase large subunit
MSARKNKKYLLIGNSAGGIGAAEAIREKDNTSSVVVIADESYPTYSRPLISEYLAEGRSLNEMLFRPVGFYKSLNIQQLLGTKVIRIDPTNHHVELDNGNQEHWDRLLIATGSTPIIPSIQGIELQGVFTFNTLDDAKVIDRYLGGVTQAVVIGGGLIGVSVTEALIKRGIEVNIIEMKDKILNTILDEEASTIEEAILRQAGVQIWTNHTVTEIVGGLANKKSVTGIILDNGHLISCQLVLVAIGVRPRVELATDPSIKTDKGILVNRFMATSNKDIYACGDAAKAYDFVHNDQQLTPNWPNAYLGGRIAGLNMVGIPTQYPGSTAINSLKYFGLAAVSAGLVTPTSDNHEVLTTKSDRSYKRIILKDGIIIGMVFTEDIERSGIIYGLMKDRVNVESFKQELIGDGFGLVSLPKEIWQRWLDKSLIRSTPSTNS